MRIKDIYTAARFGLSIEIFPPKTPDGDSVLWEHLSRLTRFQPAFISCTYGAGGSTRERTVELCGQIQQRFGIAATAHFTCVGGTREQLLEWLHYATSSGIGNIMALRGDAPAGMSQFPQVEGGLRYASELVSLIRDHFPELGIGVAGYPEKHNEAASLDIDLANLKNKVDCGADAVYTQLFFDNASYFSFRDRCHGMGITIPLVPGIMPVTNFAQIKRITSLCGARLPTELAERLEQVQDDKDAQFEVGVDFAVRQCRELIEAGVPGLHFYALNRSQACEMILDALDYTPAAV